MNLRISVAVTEAPLLALIRSLGSARRTEMNHAAGVEVQETTRAHIAALTRKPGPWGDRPSSNHYAQAAEKVGGASALTAGPEGAVLTISHVGFTRAFRTVKIAPRTAKTLALPIHPAAFGHRAAELWDRMGLFIPKGKRIIAATIGGVVTPLYIMVRSVTQKQDRSLLPSDEQFQRAAKQGVWNWIVANNEGKL